MLLIEAVLRESALPGQQQMLTLWHPPAMVASAAPMRVSTYLALLLLLAWPVLRQLTPSAALMRQPGQFAAPLLPGRLLLQALSLLQQAAQLTACSLQWRL